MAAFQVFQRGVRYEGAVVQLDHLQAVVSAGSAAEVSDAVVGDQLAVRQTLREHSSYPYEGSVTRAFVKASQRRRSRKRRRKKTKTHQDLQARAVDGQLDEGSICDLTKRKEIFYICMFLHGL